MEQRQGQMSASCSVQPLSWWLRVGSASSPLSTGGQSEALAGRGSLSSWSALTEVLKLGVELSARAVPVSGAQLPTVPAARGSSALKSRQP